MKIITMISNHLSKYIFIILAVLAVIFRSTPAINSMLVFFAVITLLVVAHELAHYFTAKIFRVKIIEAGIGFPPRVFGYKFRDIIYSINLLPIGGFVKLLGEEASEDPDSLSQKNYLQRFIILVSGSVVNLILPILLFSAAFMIPHEIEVGNPQVSFVHENSPASMGGMQTGDIIVSINERKTENIQTAVRLIRINLGKEINFKIKRSNELIDLQVIPRWNPPVNQGPTGIKIMAQYPFTEKISMSFLDASKEGLRMTLDSWILFRNEIITWFNGNSQPEFAGPVGIANITGEVAREGGVASLLSLTAILSLNLGILNLLPLPMLDGGRILLLFIEFARRGKKMNPQREAFFHLTGFFLFIFLAIIITINDLLRVI